MESVGDVLFWVFGGFFSILTVLGNSLVMYLIISRKRLRSTINWFLFSLAAADLSVGLTFLPSIACESASVCSKCVTMAVRWLFLNLSMTNLCALTVDRYMAIVTPLKYVKLKVKRRHMFFYISSMDFTFCRSFCAIYVDVLYRDVYFT